MKVDLFLGSDIGLWALNEIPKEFVNNVFTFDNRIREVARSFEKDNPQAMYGINIHYPKVFKLEFINSYDKLYNLHPGYLPWGRGFYPMFWALFEGTPAGATLHEITEGIDEGPIVKQVQVPYTDLDTGDTLYERVRKVERDLFKEFWPKLVSGQEIKSYPQQGVGSNHYKREFVELKTLYDKLTRCLIANMGDK